MASVRKTPNEIGLEILVLQKLRDTDGVRSNTKAYINAQIQVLAAGMSNDSIFNQWGEDGDDPNLDCLSSALDALQWRDDGGEAPNKGWVEVIG